MIYCSAGSKHGLVVPSGGFPEPPGGFPEPFRTNVLTGRPLKDGRAMFEGRPGAELKPYDFTAAEAKLKKAYGNSRITKKEVLSHALYPKVFKDFMESETTYGKGIIEKLPTHLFLGPISGRFVSLSCQGWRALLPTGAFGGWPVRRTLFRPMELLQCISTF